MFGPVKLPQPIIQWDPVVRGFGMRLNCNGTRQYIAKVCLNGKDRKYTLGPVDLIKLEDARELVRRMKLLAKAGEDPKSLVKDFQIKIGSPQDSQAATGITFKEFTSAYIERYAKVYKKSWLKDKQRIELYLFPAWADRQLASITRFDFQEVFSAISKTRKTAANKLRQTVSTMFKQAVVMGYLPDNSVNPVFGVRQHKQHSRGEKVSVNDLPKLCAAIENYPDPCYANAIKVVLLTGLRHSEVIKLRWSWVCYKQKQIQIPGKMTKNQKPHLLNISEELEKLLRSIPRKRGCDYVFPSKHNSSTGHLSRIDKAWAKIRTEAGLPNLWIHDLRRSVGCFVLEQTGSLSVVRDLLNHSNQHVTATYGFYDKDALKPVVENYGNFIGKFFSGRGSEEGEPAHT